MRVLVADRDAAMLQVLYRAFAAHFDIETATSKADCIALLREREFDVIVACEKLADGAGLHLLTHVTRNSPDTLRIFAARSSRLKLLKGKLGLFGLFRTLSYPLDARKLMSALTLARAALELEGPAMNVRHVVLEDEWTGEQPSEDGRDIAVQANMPVTVTAVHWVAPGQGRGARQARASGAPRRARGSPPGAPSRTDAPSRTADAPSRADTRSDAEAPSRREARSQLPAQQQRARVARGEPAASSEGRVSAQPRPPAQRTMDRSKGTPTQRTADASIRTPAPRTADGSKRTPAQRMLESGGDAARPVRQPTVSQRVAFQRALARREAQAAQAARAAASFDSIPMRAEPRYNRSRSQQGNVLQSSLASLARAATQRRPLYDPSLPEGGSDRTTVMVGTGLGVAIGALFLTLKLLNGGDSIAQSPVASAATKLVPSFSAPMPFSEARPAEDSGAGFTAPRTGGRGQTAFNNPRPATNAPDPANDMRPLEPELAPATPQLSPGDPGYEPPPTPPNFEPALTDDPPMN